MVQDDCQGENEKLVCDLEGQPPAEKCKKESSFSKSISSSSFSNTNTNSRSNYKDTGTQISLDSFKDDNPSDEINYKALRTTTSTSSDINQKQSLSSYDSSMRDESTQCK